MHRAEFDAFKQRKIPGNNLKVFLIFLKIYNRNYLKLKNQLLEFQLYLGLFFPKSMEKKKTKLKNQDNLSLPFNEKKK